MAAVAEVDVVVIGAGAAGLMCAATAAYQGHRVRVLDTPTRRARKSSCPVAGGAISPT